MPLLDRILPTSLWGRFSRQFFRATGIHLSVRESGTETAPCVAGTEFPCDEISSSPLDACAGIHRKAAQQAAACGEAMLFRCPYGFLLFAVPLRNVQHSEQSPLVLLGGPILPEPLDSEQRAELNRHFSGEEGRVESYLTSVPVFSPRTVVEQAQLAELTLRLIVQGNQVKESFSARLSQVMTLFELSSDLSVASTEHELYALGLNILGVLFNVESAAIMLLDPPAARFRVHTAMGSMEKILLPWTLVENASNLAHAQGVGWNLHLTDAHAIGKLGLPEEVETLTVFHLPGAAERDGLLVLLNADLSDDSELLVKGFANQISVAIQQQQLRKALAEKARELEAVRQTSRQLAACLEPEQLFDAMLEEARKLTGARKGSLMLAGEDGEELTVKAVSGMNGSIVQKVKVRPGQGVAGRVFSSGEPIVVRNIEMDNRFQRKNRPRYATKSFCSIPITTDGRTIGVLNLADKLTGEIFDDSDLELLQAVASQATIAIERSLYFVQSRELRKISITDPLTGLLNRRYFQERLAEEVDRATRHLKPLSLMMVDVDHFKLYNDANGHLAGDKALVMLARNLRDSVRTIDVVSRFGGEEFAVILPVTRKEEAIEIGQRLRTEVERLYFAGEEALPGKRLTVSIGVATFPEDARDIKSLIQRSDRALYQAKAQGRNAIVPYMGQSVNTPGEPSSQAWTKLL